MARVGFALSAATLFGCGGGGSPGTGSGGTGGTGGTGASHVDGAAGAAAGSGGLGPDGAAGAAGDGGSHVDGAAGAADGAAGSRVDGAAGASGGSSPDGGRPGLTCGGPLGWGPPFAVFSPDASLVAIGSPSSHLEVRHWPDDALVVDISDGIYGVTAIAFSGDGTRIAAANTTSLKVWRVSDGTLQTEIPQLASRTALALSWTGDVIAGLGQGAIWIWQEATPSSVAAIPANYRIGGLAVSPDGTLVATTYLPGGVAAVNHTAVWSVATGASLWDNNYGNTAGISPGRVIFSPDGTTLAVGKSDGVELVPISNPGAARVIYGAYDPWAYSADGTAIVGTVQNSAGTNPALFRVLDATVVRSYSLPDAGRLLTVGLSSNLAVRSIDVGSRVFGLTENGTSVGTQPAIIDVGRWAAISADGHRAATAPAVGGPTYVTVWDVDTLLSVQAFPGSGPLDLAPDGSFLVHTDGSKTLIVEPLTGGSSYQINTGAQLNAVAVSPSGALIVTGNGDNTATLRNSSDGTVRFSLWDFTNGHAQPVTAVAFSKDEKLVATGSGDRTLKLWNVADGTFVRTLTGSGQAIQGVVFSSDGSRLVSADGGSGAHVRYWKVADGTNISSQTLSYAPEVLLSPDDTTVYVPSSGAIQRFHLPDWSVLPSLSGYTGSVSQIGLSADGHRLVSTDGTGRIDCIP